MTTSQLLLLTAVSAVLLVTCPVPISGAASSQCPLPHLGSRYIQEHGEKCYQFVFEEKTWIDARKYCHNRGAALANANTRDKQQFLQNVLTSRSKLGDYFDKNGFWIGLHDRDSESAFEWDRGSGKSEVRLGPYTNWQSGEPNNLGFGGQDCVYMRRQYGWRWVDVDCSGGIGRSYSFACEYDLKPKTTTTTTTTTTTKKPTTTSTTRKTTTPTPKPTTSTTTPKSTTTTTTPKPSFTSQKDVVTASATSAAISVRSTFITIPSYTRSANVNSVAEFTEPHTANSSTNLYGIDMATTPDEVSTEAVSSLPIIKSTSDGALVSDADDIFIPADDGSDQEQKHSTAEFRRSEAESHNDDMAKVIALPISLVLILAVLIAVIVIVLLRRRRRKQSELPLTLSNPCYGTDGDTGYPVCRIPDGSNIYVDVGENPPDQCDPNPESDNLANAALPDKGYMKSSKPISPPSSPIQQTPLPNPRDDESQEKFLDEYGLYTSDGYMAPKHLYAEVPEISPPPRKPPTTHYSIPQNNQACDLDAGVYEDIRDSRLQPDLDSHPADDLVYEVPLSARVSNSKPVPDSVAAAAAEYDVPRSILPIQSD